MAHSPVKPPRGVKYGKESNASGLLVTVIKSLDSSETLEERQKEKQKIEREAKKTDVRLNELVAQHDGDLAKVMNLFGQVSAKVSTSRSQINHVKTNLYECKKLLRCRRDELQRLWSEAMQQKYVADMLGQISDLRKVASSVQVYMNKKHYLHATMALNEGVQLANGPLSPIEGLSDVRQDLKLRGNQLFAKLIEEVNKHIYQMSTAETLSNFHRHGSTRNSNFATGGGRPSSPFQRNGVRRSAERAAANQKMRKVLVELTVQGNAFDLKKSEFVENMDLMDEDASFFIIVECFAQLKRLPEALETIKGVIDSELKLMVNRTSAHILAIRKNLVATELTHLQHQLLELLELLHTQFKIVAASHALLLKHFLSATQRHVVADVKFYTTSDLWTQAQIVLQSVLTDYLDIQNTTSVEVSTTASEFVEQSTNINKYFGRSKQQTKKTLFKFDKSSVVDNGESLKDAQNPGNGHKRNASDVSNHEQLSPGKSTSSTSNVLAKRPILICEPDASLLRIIYIPLIGYVQEIEALLKQKSSQSCALRSFIESHVKDTFLAKGHSRTLELTIDGLAKNQDAWRTIISPEEMKALGLSRPLLQSTVLFERRITETKQLIEDLPDYSEELLKMVCKLLKTYRETCQAAYRGIVQPETEDKRIYSVAWLKDDDITRFLKTLPNWTDLKTSGQQARLDGSSKKIKSMVSEEESPTQVQQRNIREAEMLTSNLGEGGISQHEILSDIGVLKELAIMQESMEWFSYRISDFANDLRQPVIGTNESVTIKDGTIKVLTNLALEFDELANTCLLVLHLEVRVQCFHYLKENSSDKLKNSFAKNSESLEPDLKVLKLTKVLSEMEEAMLATLHPRKTKYIFEGLAHLAAKILTNAANLMVSIDQASVQRMCRNALSLKQTLSSITSSREIALDQTIAFYELFYKDPQEILTQIVERGATYSEMQYLNALQLACKSKGITDSNTIASYQQQLSDILGTKPKLTLASEVPVALDARSK